jgi:DNA-binding MarR family transcriptional regulator
LSRTDDLTRLYFQMFNEIGIISQLSSNRLERVLPAGMSIAQFSLLNHLVRLGGAWAPSRLARAFQVTKGAMTNTMQRLEAQGLIRIAPDPEDARGKLVEITDSGRKMRDKCVRATGEVMADIVRLVPADDVRAALPLLEHLRKTLDENR